MELTYSKPIILVYFLLAFASCVFFIAGEIGILPIMLMISVFMVYFAVKAFQGFFKSGKLEIIPILIYWNIAVLLSLQVVLLFSNDFKYLVLCVTMGLLIFQLIIIYRYERMKELILFNVLISMISGVIYFNF